MQVSFTMATKNKSAYMKWWKRSCSQQNSDSHGYALKAKPKIDMETENYKELDSYESYDLQDLRIGSSTISSTLVVALTSCIQFRGKFNFCVSESRQGGNVLYKWPVICAPERQVHNLLI